ncbi:peptidase, S54 family [Clostridiales bacterium oral taxon 876 str. F0540]|nr:peptidase, S54 family [Clostridiales bacterium oral taxon 876 str. F0540]
MKEDLIKNIIEGMSRVFSYGIIEISNDYNLMSSWALVRNIDINSKKVIVFARDDGFDYMNLSEHLKEMLNVSIVELNKIVISESMNVDTYDDETIVINYNDNSILYYGTKSEQTVNELLNLSRSLPSDNSTVSENRDKYWVTYSIIALNIIAYIVTAFLSGSIFDSDINVLINLGAKYNELINRGEYYRLITCMFLHGGLLHVALNMYALYSIGPLVERLYGKTKYIVIYFASGILSSIFSYMFSDNVSVGASGAIFGLLGTTLVFAVKKRKNIGKDFLRNIASVIIVNLIIGFTMSNIDNFGHLGGLVGGIIITLILDGIKKKR